MSDPNLPSLDDVPVASASATGPSASMSATPVSLEPDSGFDIRGLLQTIGRKFMRGAAIFGALLIVFLTAAWISIPTDALRWRISHEARKKGFNITIDDIHLRPWGTVKLEGVTWTLAPSRPTSTPVPFTIEELDVSVSLWRLLLLKDIDVEFEGTLDEGYVKGEYFSSDDEARMKIDIGELPLYAVPKLQDAVNAPVRGLFAMKVDLTAPGAKWAKSTGRLEVHCASCTVGDGDTKLYVPNAKKSSMLAKGVTIPEIDLGTLDGVLEVKDGKAVAEEFGNESKDILIRISGGMTFKDPIGKSRLDLLIKIFITPELREKSEQVELLVATANPKVMMDPPDDGWMAMYLEGNFKNRRFRGIKQLTKAEAQRAKRDASRTRAKDRADKRAEQRAAREAAKAEAEAAKQAAGGTEEPEPEPDPSDPSDPSESGEPEPKTRTIPPEAGVINEAAAGDEAGDEAAGEEEEEDGDEEEGDDEEEDDEEEGDEEEGDEDEGDEEEGDDEVGQIQ